MDLDFIAELDRDLSNLGSDKVWKKTVAGVELWVSPLTLIGQEKVSDTIANSDLGATIVSESKRLTLAHAIVGFGKHDLREFRHGVSVFPSKNKEGKPVKIALEKYMYEKLGTWGHEFIDNLFDVYADLMETHKRENLKDIKFDNLKSPAEELSEMMLRVSELRESLNLPPLIEGTEADVKSEEKELPVPTQFNPFSPDIPETDMEDSPLQAVNLPEGEKPKYTPKSHNVPTGVLSVQQDVDPKFEEERLAQDDLDQAISASKKEPDPVVLRDDVLESRTRPAAPIPPPQIDRIVAPRNPRFAVPPK